jgi:hypothetical protein
MLRDGGVVLSDVSEPDARHRPLVELVLHIQNNSGSNEFILANILNTSQLLNLVASVTSVTNPILLLLARTYRLNGAFDFVLTTQVI